MAEEITIIYYTDNSLDKDFERKIQEKLHESANGKRIISVSQKPIDFGENICVGDIGRSHLSLFKQIQAGVELADTKYVALAEHDCIYTPEHFDWRPPTDDKFYYNINHLLVDWNGEYAGMYSYQRRKVLSNLICNRELLLKANAEKIMMLEEGAKIRKGQAGACEYGVCDNRQAFIDLKKELESLGKDLGKGKYGAVAFATKTPNLDIRHGGNFSGGRRAKHRRFWDDTWGSFHALMDEIPPEDWYQEATIDGVEMPFKRKNDTNEKRWNKLIKPLLPFKGEGRKFVDLGCNAGFYCRKMSELGFKVEGVEKDHIAVRHGAYWEHKDPRGVKINWMDINDFDIPAASIVLLANVHYWLKPEDVDKLVKKLRERAHYVIVVGRYQPSPKHNSLCDENSVEHMFGDWNIYDNIFGKKHFSAIFQNPDIIEVDTDEIFPKQQLAKSRWFYPSYKKLIETGDAIDYIAYGNKRKFDNKKIQQHIDLVDAVKKDGIKKPLVISGEKIIDGDHRLILAKELNIKKILCQKNM